MIDHEVGPFAIVPLWVLERLVVAGRPEALRLYVALHEWTRGDDRQCHPGRTTIAERIGASVDTVDRDVRTLVEIGALVVTPRFSGEGDRTSNDYTIRVTPAARPPGRVRAATGSRVDAAGSKRIREPDKQSRSATAETRPPVASPGQQEPIAKKAKRTRKSDSDPHLARSLEVVKAWWEDRKAEHPDREPSALPYGRLANEVRGLCATGRPDKDIRWALDNAPTHSIGAMEIALARARTDPVADERPRPMTFLEQNAADSAARYERVAAQADREWLADHPDDVVMAERVAEWAAAHPEDARAAES